MTCFYFIRSPYTVSACRMRLAFIFLSIYLSIYLSFFLQYSFAGTYILLKFIYCQRCCCCYCMSKEKRREIEIEYTHKKREETTATASTTADTLIILKRMILQPIALRTYLRKTRNKSARMLVTSSSALFYFCSLLRCRVLATMYVRSSFFSRTRE